MNETYRVTVRFRRENSVVPGRFEDSERSGDVEASNSSEAIRVFMQQVHDNEPKLQRIYSVIVIVR